jgi:hypothetical protein
MTTVVTGFDPAGYALYGRRFIEAFEQYWPASVRLVLYLDEPVPAVRAVLRRQADAPGLAAFVRRHGRNRRANGLDPFDGVADRHASGNYSFRFDAVRFCKMAFNLRDAAKTLGAGTLVWLDADTVTFANVPEGWVETLLGDAACAYIGRGGKYPDIGFLAFRLPEAAPLIESYVAPYNDDSVFHLHEWHSAYVFREALRATDIPTRDLSPGGDPGKVWEHSAVGTHLLHFKGPQRKADAERIWIKRQRQPVASPGS